MRKVKPDLTKKSGKYFLERVKGKTKSDAARAVDMSPKNTTIVEASPNYLALEAKYGTIIDELQKQILLPSLIKEHAGLIEQNEEKSVKLAAIKLAYERLEPEGGPKEDNSQKVVVVLK